MNPAAARALEFLIGAAPGAIAGGATGLATYDPEGGQFWRDEAGAIQGRELTADEDQARIKRMLQGAALGAALGGGGAIAGGRARESLLRRYDAEDARHLVDMYSEQPRGWSRLGFNPAKRLTTEIGQAGDEAVATAQAARAQSVFGGQLREMAPNGVAYPHPETTAHGKLNSILRGRMGLDPGDLRTYIAQYARGAGRPLVKEAAAFGLASLLKGAAKAPVMSGVTAASAVKVPDSARKLLIKGPPKPLVSSFGSAHSRPSETSMRLVSSTPSSAMPKGGSRGAP
jgi:hypothetical protein